MAKKDDTAMPAIGGLNMGYDLTRDLDPVGDVLDAPADSLCCDIETVTEYLIVPADDLDQRLARVVSAPKWKDLRDQPASKLPKPVSPLYNVWEVKRAATKPLYLGSRHLGITYLVGAGKGVLTNSVPLAFFDLSSIIDAIFGPPAPPPPCPSVTAISGSGTAWSAYFTTRAAADAAARGLVPGRAAVDAGLEFNAFTCPNPACTTKTLGPVIHAITNSDTYLSVTASLLYLQWRYIARADYTWASAVTCT